MPTTYKPSQVTSAVRVAVSARRPLFISGPPGVGKSAIVARVARELEMSLRDVRATLLDPVDLRGLPVVDHDSGLTRWYPPSFLPKTEDGPTLFFADELNAAAPAVQTAFFQLILDRRLGEYVLPATCAMIAAGNRIGDGASAVRMPSALANRFVHIEMAADLDDWCAWASAAGIAPVNIAFLRYRPELLHQHSKVELAFPTPRSWEFVDSIMRQTTDSTTEHALIEGAVGTGAATEHGAFVALWRKLPNIDAILGNPKHADVPTDPATRYAVTYAVAARATEQNFKAVCTYLDRLPEEYSVIGMKHATSRDPKLANTEAFAQWCIAHTGVLQYCGLCNGAGPARASKSIAIIAHGTGANAFARIGG